MKNITILMTIICAMVGPFALTQSVLRLTPAQIEKVKVDTVFITVKPHLAEVEGVENFDLKVLDGNGPSTTISDLPYNNNGEFEYYTSNNGGYLRLTPQLNLDPMNGVNTYDLILISRHILGKEFINSPYWIIAADANNSGTVTSFDIVELRKLIVGTYNKLPNVPSWRFIDKKQVFPDPLNPFSVLLKEYAEPLTVFPPFRADFVALKTGDVDGTAIPNNFTSMEDRFLSTFNFNIQDKKVKAGEEFLVTFSGERPMEGYQFTMNTKGLSVMEIMPGDRLTKDHFALFSPEKQSGWTPAFTAAVENGAATFKVRFKAMNDGKLRDMLQTGDQITPAAAFDENGSAYRLGLKFQEEETAVSTTPNAPNPWSDNTTISFSVPSDSPTTFRIYDIAGKVVYSKSMFCNKGFHQIALNKADVSGSGVFFYEITAGDFKEKGKMIKM